MARATVIAFDPGETTGYCVLQVAQESLLGANGLGDTLERQLIQKKWGEIDCRRVTSKSAENEVFQHTGWNFNGENEGVLQMMQLALEYELPAIVCEDFVLDVRKATMGRDLLTPVRIISSFGWACWSQAMETSVFVQNRTDPKRICTDERLRTWGLYDSHSGPHARDAMRHAYFFLRSCRGNTIQAREKRWRAWPHLFDDPVVWSAPVKKRPKGERIPGL